jgi:hypothetical protein
MRALRGTLAGLAKAGAIDPTTRDRLAQMENQHPADREAKTTRRAPNDRRAPRATDN